MKKLVLVGLLSICLSLITSIPIHAQILTVREQARIVDELLTERFENLLPTLMEREQIDMWIVMGREYDEDPVLKTMLPAEWLNARRRTILVFYRDANVLPTSKKIERLAVARYDVGNALKAAWDMKKFPNQWDALVDIIKSRNPKKIGINSSKTFAHADGISFTELTEFSKHLPQEYEARLTSAQDLAVAWLETRTEREMQIYPQLVNATHKIIQEGFSEKVITPGITTTDDVVWWFRQKIRDLGYDTWFHPTVAIQRNDAENFEHLRSFSARPKGEVILPGDLLHVDIGISYLRLNTDIQQHAYVLKANESSVPASLRQAFAKANRLQDILIGHFRQAKTGNQILSQALAQAKKEGIEASIYSHPIGYHGHAAGPAIGMWDNQVQVIGTGDVKLNLNTAYSIELNASSLIPEWKKSVRIMLEEDAYFDAQGVRYINGRQREIYTIPRINSSLNSSINH
jgi:Xaa-Pro aminopeptidase